MSRERLEEIGKICAGEGSLCHNHPFAVTADDVKLTPMIAADALGREGARRRAAGNKLPAALYPEVACFTRP